MFVLLCKAAKPDFVTNINGIGTQTNNLILSCLELLQGMLLLHSPSRHLFAREIHMNVSFRWSSK